MSVVYQCNICGGGIVRSPIVVRGGWFDNVTYLCCSLCCGFTAYILSHWAQLTLAAFLIALEVGFLTGNAH